MSVPPYNVGDPAFYQRPPEEVQRPRQVPGPPPVLTEDRVQLLIERAITASLHRHEGQLLKHIDSRFDSLYRALESAFPGGDPHAHRLAHEKAIRDAEGWDKLKAEMISKLATSGIWAAAAWVLYLNWRAVVESEQK